jgi:NAD(P)-dependent dehydrogenase (short-subunit alcohol dehydrogenase family)
MAAVVITGVSRGLGAALFDTCNARGDRILAVGRHFTEQQRAARDERGDAISLHTTDLEDPRWLPDADTLRPFLRDATDTVLIHNAAVIEPIGAIGRLPEQAILKSVGVNFTAPMLITNAFIRAAPRDARLRVLFISSSAAYRVVDGCALYCATKAASEMFFNVLASQFAGDKRVSVANVDPGKMDTGMQADIRRAATSGAYLPEQQQWLDAHEEGRLADPAEIAERILKEHLY